MNCSVIINLPEVENLSKMQSAKEETDFWKNKAKCDGLQGYCKACHGPAQAVSWSKSDKRAAERKSPEPAKEVCLN